MSVKLESLILKLESAIAAESNPRKASPLRSRLAVLHAAKAEMDDDDGDEGDEEDEDEESKAEKAAKKAEEAKKHAEASKHRAKAAEFRKKAEEAEEAASAAEGDEEDEGEEDEAASRAAKPSATLTPGAAAAIVSQGAVAREALARIEKLEKSAAARELSALIADAKASRRITPGEAKTLATKSASFVRDFLEMRPRALVATDEEALSQPDGSPSADVPKNIKAIVEQAVVAMGLEGEKADKFRETAFADHRNAMAKSQGVTH